MSIENDSNAGELSNTDQGISSDGMAAIEAKFAEVFDGTAPGDADNLPVADAPEIVPAEKSEQRQRIDAQSKREAADELMEEGLVDADGNKPVPPTAPEAKTEAVLAPVADAAAPSVIDSLTRHIANANGYSDERIDRIHKADPELAQEIFGKLADDYTALSRQYAAGPGSQVAPVAQQAQQQTPAPAVVSPVAELAQLFTPEGLSAFAEANGEELVEKFMKPLHKAVIEPMQRMQAFYEGEQAKLAVREREVIATQATQTFDGLSEKFSGLYGKGVELTRDQQGARDQVARLADAIRTGASTQGIEMSVKDALTRAHLVVSAPQAKQTARREVIESVQKRSSQITAKPTQRRTPAQSGGRSEQSAMEAYSRLATELGLEV